jgi:hypothetical protein
MCTTQLDTMQKLLGDIKEQMISLRKEVKTHEALMQEKIVAYRCLAGLMPEVAKQHTKIEHISSL